MAVHSGVPFVSHVTKNADIKHSLERYSRKSQRCSTLSDHPNIWSVSRCVLKHSPHQRMLSQRGKRRVVYGLDVADADRLNHLQLLYSRSNVYENGILTAGRKGLNRYQMFYGRPVRVLVQKLLREVQSQTMRLQ